MNKQIDCMADWKGVNVYLTMNPSIFFWPVDKILDSEQGLLPDTIPVFIDQGGQLFMHEIAPGELYNVRPEHIEVPIRTCTKRHYCGREEKDFFVGECKTCDAYEARKAATKQGKNLPFYVVAYGVSRAYGGPEEGGWYYDSRRILEVQKVFTWEGGLKAGRKMKEDYPTCKRGRGSVIGGEDVYLMVCYTEEQFPSEGPNQKPRYE